MRRKWNRNGFTMAELLIVVAIIGVLSAVSFIAVQTHQKNLDMAERDTIAKEIYFAAQNHLILAESQGYPGLSDSSFGTPEDASYHPAQEGSSEEYKDIYYVSSTAVNTGILNLMLPFGSIEEGVRGGHYVIRYQKKPARVLDVFYWKNENGAPNTIDYDTLFSYRNSDNRRNGNPPVGWYGGAEAVETGVTLNAPIVEIENAERLVVTVTDTNTITSNPSLQNTDGTTINTTLELIITGEPRDEQGNAAKAVIVLKSASLTENTRRSQYDSTTNKYTIVLDDITGAGLHFAELTPADGIWYMDDNLTFRPGENITVEAVAFSNDALASIAYSGGQTTNSLFADVYTGKETIDTTTGKITINKTDVTPTAMISNFRHLENLDTAVSGLEPGLGIQTAAQIADLVWASATTDASAFTSRIAAAKGVQAASVRVYKKDDSAGTAEGCYLPVNPTYPLKYSGLLTIDEGTDLGDAISTTDSQDENTKEVKCHTITGVKVGTSAESPYAGAGGLFGAPTAALTVENLALIDFDINASGNAGALAGTLPSGSSVTNVVAYNSTANATATIVSTSGSVGGLIGSMTGTTVEKCAAALVVSSKAATTATNRNAGGLVGEAHGSSAVSNSYSGGHTKSTADATTGAIEYDPAAPNVNSDNGMAGGLIGDAEQTAITNCYSTCSVKGTTAGGLVGKATIKINTSYCTGLVLGKDNSSIVGAFAGELNNVAPDGCYYYEIINPIDTDGVITYMPPVPGMNQSTIDGFIQNEYLKPLDYDATTYESFVDAPANWAEAQPYCPALANYYSKTQDDAPTVAAYPLRAIAISDSDTGDGKPMPFVTTHYGDWPVPEIFVVNE